MYFNRIVLGMVLGVFPLAALGEQSPERAVAKEHSALPRAQEKLRQAAVNCFKVDEKGDPVVMSFSGRHEGENGKNVVLMLKTDTDMTALDLLIYDVQNERDRVAMRFCLPLAKKIKIHAKGREGERGMEAQCRYRNDIRDEWREGVPPGQGESGGKGGDVTVYYSRPELLNLVEIKNQGGPGGLGGGLGPCWLREGPPGSNGPDGKITAIQGEPPKP